MLNSVAISHYFSILSLHGISPPTRKSFKSQLAILGAGQIQSDLQLVINDKKDSNPDNCSISLNMKHQWRSPSLKPFTCKTADKERTGRILIPITCEAAECWQRALERAGRTLNPFTCSTERTGRKWVVSGDCVCLTMLVVVVPHPCWRTGYERAQQQHSHHTS